MGGRERPIMPTPATPEVDGKVRGIRSREADPYENCSKNSGGEKKSKQSLNVILNTQRHLFANKKAFLMSQAGLVDDR